MKSGEILRRSTPRWGDLDGLMELMNSLVEEDADIHRTEKKTREQVADWLGRKTQILRRSTQLASARGANCREKSLTELHLKLALNRAFSKSRCGNRSGRRLC